MTWPASAIHTPDSRKCFRGSRRLRCSRAATPGRSSRIIFPDGPTPPFRYRDKGKLATIGRAHAVADIRGLRLSGRPAWLMWLLVHLSYLVGFENRLLVLVRWSYSFATHGRGTRLITQAADAPLERTSVADRKPTIPQPLAPDRVSTS